MNDSLLSSLGKKDSDLKVVSSGPLGVVVETELDVGFALAEDDDDEDFFEPIHLSVPARIVRHVLTINMGISFFFVVFGLVPFAVLTNPIAAITLTASAGALVVGWGIGMHMLRAHETFAMPAFVMWILVVFVFVFSLAALLQSMAPFQACVIVFIQSCAALQYCLYVNREIDHWTCAGIMMVVGLLVWILGLVAFIEEQDWITSAILFLLCCIFHPVYSAWRVRERNYNLEDKELVRASIEYFTGWTAVKCARRPPPPSSAPVAGKSTALLNADNRVPT